MEDIMEGEKTHNDRKCLNFCLFCESEVHRHRLTCFEILKGWSLRRCLPGRQPVAGHEEGAWLLPLGFAHLPLGPQNSNDFLFPLSNMGLLTRIMMKLIQRSITTDKEKAKNLS